MSGGNRGDSDADIANIHLDMLGEKRVFAVTVPAQSCTPLALLPVARELTAQATEVAIEQARAQGREVRCKAGCGACCRQLVAISPVEAQALADLVSALPTARQTKVRERFRDCLSRLEAGGLLDRHAPRGRRALWVDLGAEAGREETVRELARRYFRLGIPCPFLEAESCSIHPERPLVCREYHVTSPPERCAHLYEAKVESVQPPLHMSGVLSRALAQIAGTKPWTIPLVLSLEWAEVNGDWLLQPHDGQEMLVALMHEIDREYARPFDLRGGEEPGKLGRIA